MTKNLKLDPYILFQNIKKARILAKLTQKQLAEKIGVSVKTISAYETGRAIPPLPTLLQIAETTDTRLEHLIGKKQKTILATVERVKKLEERVANLEQLIVKILKKNTI